ncbi:hypothetical protein BbuMM1_C100 (plasmid) [Borreliella burgdorferi]|nr:hypothetical protein BbuMM1_C070 [Borreliella burgdorferi]AXK69639.1 hypothetical protein BbuMM1_C100 [Borreliella burgdorferi]
MSALNSNKAINKKTIDINKNVKPILGFLPKYKLENPK